MTFFCRDSWITMPSGEGIQSQGLNTLMMPYDS